MILLSPLSPLGGVVAILIGSDFLKHRRKGSLGSCLLRKARGSLTWKPLLCEASPGLLGVEPISIPTGTPVMADVLGSQAKGRSPAPGPPNDV